MDTEQAKKEKARLLEKLKKLNQTINKSGKKPRAPKPEKKSTPKKSRNSPARKLKRSKTVLKNLMKHQYAWVFNEPVDPVKLGIPTYFEIIKRPMDLGTIKLRLEQGYYSDVQSFASDVRLVFKNAQKFNKPDHDVHKMAQTLKDIFEKRFAQIMEAS
mmetsp:Transcript_12486/g.30734  ORF Transcript_12486/g.30734 Transcript_12486/m.30734 type:complete len:158 (-) Transcript_12486:81-554(-)